MPMDAMLLGNTLADVARIREEARRRRLRNLLIVLSLVGGWMWIRFLSGNPVEPGLPELGPNSATWLPPVILVVMFGLVMLLPLLAAGRSPHVLYRSSEIKIGMDDVRGAGIIKEEVQRTLDLFLAYKTFQDTMGGTPRRAILFEGPPGTGKTYMAKAMAREAGVPFLFVSSSAFQSMYYGQTNRKIRSYFKALRKYAREEGGAIGFIDQANRYVHADRQIRKPEPVAANVLIVGATNRAADLDPALLRPGRFDRSVYFGLPGRTDRRDIIDYYLSRKAHHPELDDETRRDTIAAMTAGYSPVMIEHLFDEALVWALRRGAAALDWHDLQQAKMTEEIGLKQPVEYTPAERLTIATHEAGHATVAHVVGKDRTLEVLSIIKRRDALGLLAHSDREERFTNTRSELLARIQISMGGMVAEELAFGEAGTGPSGDLQYATTLAAQMVGALGMSGSLVSFGAADYPGAGNLVAKVLGDETSRSAVEAILAGAKAEAERILAQHRHVADSLRDALLERDELVGDEILEVIRDAEARVIDLTTTDELSPN